MSETDLVTIVASKEEVLAGDTSGLLTALRTLIATPESALQWKENQTGQNQTGQVRIVSHHPSK